MRIARAAIPQGLSVVGGKVLPKLLSPGCTVTGQGVAGFVQVQLDGAPDVTLRDANLDIIVSPGPGSAIAGGVTFGVSSIDNAGTFGVKCTKQSDGTAVDLPYTVTVELNNPGPWPQG